MKLNELSKVKLSQDKKTTIQFITTSDHRGLFPYCCSVKDLIDDWYHDCNFCPENGDVLLLATLYVDGVAYPIEGIGLDESTTFETMMVKLEKCYSNNALQQIN